ncbi:coronafacic acid synthetase [Brenneria corticis]|uniref:Coronafacic acid synthetase n=1 Tax=Brenneria corticis TaxID=2173106 RepID=A0A2U1TX85_9GAMM|nr:coronafacic acid synthetase [Brenneria sp. CFCC 11842]PWC14028.1 coronafacic acid synthetase [Brenneria sp. CFCC 11842]
MNEQAVINACGLAILGRGVATAPDLSSLKPKQKASLYADPLAWLVLEAVEQALKENSSALASSGLAVGHIAVSDQCTAHTLHGIGTTIPSGRISPLRFSGACPGMICCLPSLFLGFSGPSLVLSMPPASGLPPALAIASIWLHECSATHVIVTYHRKDTSGHGVTSLILANQDTGGQQ